HMAQSFALSLASRKDALPAQLQKAADWIMRNPQDTALLSMREQARRADVQPATMTRLAQALGYDGYEAIRALHREALRNAAPGLAATAAARDRLGANSPQDAAAAMLEQTAAQIAVLGTAQTLVHLEQAASLIAQAPRVFCLGLRSSHAVAWHVWYALSLITDRASLLDGIGGVGLDGLAQAQAGDVLFVCGVAPYTRAVVEAVMQAHARAMRIVALTDSPLSPLIVAGDPALIVPTHSASFLHSMAPAFAMAEILVALVARGDDPAVLARLEGLDRQLAAFNTYYTPPA
ncbi:MAG: MurR/RpiR family transcriptional regulator, partial [Roseinatronobacter sp.]|nr:MurR/RpiR family transcriptional regulator [Roseinatronobacter sp.]